MRELTDEVKPTRKASPNDDQPALFSRPVHTSLLGAFGAKIQSGMRMAKEPQMWRMSIVPSTSGSFRAKKVLKIAQTVTTAMARRVPW